MLRSGIGNLKEDMLKYEVRVLISRFVLDVSYLFLCCSLIFLVFSSTFLAKLNKIQTLAKKYVFLIQKFECRGHLHVGNSQTAKHKGTLIDNYRLLARYI